MATRAVQTVITFSAWDTLNQVGKTGDAANFTLRWVKDGTSGATSNSASELDATNSPGEYKITMTSSETDCLFGELNGKSSTANIVIIPTRMGFEAVPNAAAGAVGGLPLAADASGRVDVIKVNGTSQTAKDLGASVTQTGDAYARLGAPAGASVSVDVAAVKTDTAAVKVQTDKLAFTVANQIDANVIDWKGAAAPAMTGDAFARLGVAGAGLTALGDTRVAHLDADVSSRSTYAGGDTSGTTTLLTRVPAALIGGRMDSNVGAVNGHAVTGDGHTGTEWGPA